MFQVAPNYAVDCRFRPLTDFGVHFQSYFGDDACLKAHERRVTMRRYAAGNVLGAFPKPILTTCERRRARYLLGQKMVQAPPDERPWLSVFWASWCSRSADTSFDFVRRGIHAGFSPSACRGLCWNCLGCSGVPNDESRLATKLAAPAAEHSELAVAGAEQVIVDLVVAVIAVAPASRPC